MKIVASTERAFLPALKKVAARARVRNLSRPLRLVRNFRRVLKWRFASTKRGAKKYATKW